MIKFGTDGWRGIIGEDFTSANLRRVSRAVASYLIKKGGSRVIVGYDRRFLSDRFAELAATEFARAGLNVELSSTPVPTPCLSFAVKALNADAGVIITASHNPPIYNGLKFKEASGGPALPETTVLIEAELKAPVASRSGAVRGKNSIERADLLDPYLEQLRSLINYRQVGNQPLKILVNPMFGSASGVLPRLFKGSKIEIKEINSTYNPAFGGKNPEPIWENLKEMPGRLRQFKADLGIAFDGDGDRLALIDETGNYVSSQKVFALILYQLLHNRRISGEVAKTVSTTRLIDLICEKEKVKLHVTPVGFKYIALKMITDNVVIGGEESGGIGIKEHLPDRDAILAAALVIEMIATERKPLSGLLSRLYKELGHHYYGRQDIGLSFRWMRRIIEDLEGDPQLSLSSSDPMELTRLDGFKYRFSNGSWLLLRPSGTEPVLRIYAEAESAGKVQTLLKTGAEKCLFRVTRNKMRKIVRSGPSGAHG